MRLHKPTASFLAVLLCACGRPAANQTSAAADGNATLPAPAADAAGGTPQQQPASRSPVSEPSDEVTLSASPQQVTEGSTVTLTLRNGAERQIGYNLCTSTLQTATGRSVPTSRVCTMELRTLDPGRTATYRYELPVNMLEGSYRFLTQVHWMRSDRTGTIRSNPVEVRSD